MAAWPYNTAAWRQARARALVRDDHRCQLRLQSCTGLATEGGHIRPPSEGGDPFALANVQAVCKSCNVAERNERHARAWRREQGLEPTDVEVVRPW